MNCIYLNLRYYLLLVILIFGIKLYATGSSSLESEIIPISINKDGNILCKTRFTKNEMGAYRGMEVKYGFCVITKKSIIQYQGIVIDEDEIENDDSVEKYWEERNFWDRMFKSKTSTQQLQTIVQKVLKNKFTFDSLNADDYKIEKEYSFAEIQQSKQIDLTTVKLHALYGAKSSSHFQSNNIQVAYDFGHVLLTSNYEDPDSKGGFTFDYFNPWINKQGKEENIGFEIFSVTGILFID